MAAAALPQAFRLPHRRYPPHISDRIVVVPYDPEWPTRFEAERGYWNESSRPAEYEILKLRLAQEYGEDGAAYVAGKRAFVVRVLASAGLQPGRR